MFIVKDTEKQKCIECMKNWEVLTFKISLLKLHTLFLMNAVELHFEGCGRAGPPCETTAIRPFCYVVI